MVNCEVHMVIFHNIKKKLNLRLNSENNFKDLNFYSLISREIKNFLTLKLFFELNLKFKFFFTCMKDDRMSLKINLFIFSIF